jgi:hypothetical protein
MRVLRHAILRAALSVAVALAALAGGPQGLSQGPDPQPQGQSFYKPTGEEGVIQGVVSVEGEVPPRPVVSTMESDPFCVSQNRGGMRAEDIVVERGRLANALVYVESAALDAQRFEPLQWVPVLRERRCRMVPRVLAMQTGQTLYVENGDRTAHNPAFQTKVNPLFNKGLMPGQTFEMSLMQPEPPFPVRCKQHPWERGYVAVFPHPFFSVTGRSGAFAVWGLPPGDYEVVVWHEKFKEARAQVTVGPKETKVANFTLKFPADLR